MRQSSVKAVGGATVSRMREQANTRITILLLVCFLLGLGVGAFWYHRATTHGTVNPSRTAGGSLSESAQAILKRIESPVEIRFYALFSEERVAGDLRDFAGRVDQLLSEFQREADGKLGVTRYYAWSDSATSSASADGVVPFGLGKGEPAYVGLTVAQGARRETISQLTPQWEEALEFDLARAISRVVHSPSAPVTATDPAQIENATKEVKRQFPDLTAVSLEQGKRILREAALTEFKLGVSEMEKEVKAAQQRILKAESAGSEPERQAAVKELQRIRTSHTEKISQIAVRSRAQIEVLERLKTE